MFRIAVLASGSGSNLQSIIDEIENNNLDCEIEVVIGSKEGIYALSRARKHGIDAEVIKDSDEILKRLKGKVDLIVLAGYLSILKGEILEVFKDKIINIHPSLIPAFCGSKMYGLKVHEAAINKGVKYTGCTVHFVNNEVDGGAIIMQDVVPVYFNDTKEILQKRVLIREHKLLPQAIKYISENKVKIIDNKVLIKED
ncbi:phosphoribosylglycinamide formyltransferase [Clostridium chrysemydis]|uniref:phosphoribosylglycinamide formyltransferase n=1 Tax=Clostridium chrysemydis TaxID=2665504 RepID=UPI0018845DA4|nr:phosphoribosylglycinamide formyltransferase [Clostridium chrysemydis]